ncbi:gamma-glutamyl-gamma-aminobutyrate hydrolase family protein [Sporosarcina sp. FSL K6-1540]|uniref:gamma-glutamyl-gamma-aminobutyrate hydrolase family protein n=1 Tax=Sporosarcina TaxID=1569 RepID=UPI00078E6FC1|nr:MULTISPECIES: gamma-glutamyl-gamma-aminobutyrate hydrolase family protein [Sporosarcina]AMQ05571.1 gamma-glutamyl-gamma-aminobutyrate hydrolase [Sporosarcina psychrophila]QNK89390.1 gamma-glutamyl-gamma-aminobutyrate hydrolase family protein [Sporosarcina sp. resist]
MKPVIGITTDVQQDGENILKNTYVQAVIRAGGLPMIVPVGLEQDVEQLIEMFDGLLLSGGNDINPMLFNEEPHEYLGVVSPSRDSSELELARRMLKTGKPILGICRGLQVLNVAVGGTLYQDLYKQNDSPILQHIQKAPNTHCSHYVQLDKGSLLESIAGSERIQVNSYHHQSLKEVPSDFKVTAVASDGIVEAIESTDEQFVLGVQWHPEALSAAGDAVSLRIFERFISECAN